MDSKALPITFALLVLLARTGVAQQVSSKDRDERALFTMRRVAEMPRFYSESNKRIRVVPVALQEFDDRQRSDVYGRVWAVGRKGRPDAVMVVYTKTTFADDHWIQAFTSLASHKEVRAEVPWAGKKKWAPKRAGVAMARIPNAPPIAAERAARRQQMDQLAKKFSAHEIWDPDNTRYDLKLIAKPLHRYSDSKAGLHEGAIFALAHGVNPEVLLLLEAHGERQWSYGLVRFGFAGMHVRLDGKEIWSKPRISTTKPDQAYWLFHLKVPQ